MQILFFIGNGFDINLGMKTRYCDFYEFYKSIESSEEGIKKLKQAFHDDYPSWSDLELALGNYTENINSVHEFDQIFDDIGEKLSEYLASEEKKIDFSKFNPDIMSGYLSSPEEFLPMADINALFEYKRQWKSSPWYVNIITFNYTTTIDRIMADTKLLGHTKYGHPINLKNIHHIHGFYNKQMVLGVNDISQIKNKNFHKNRDILESLVKIECNKANKHTIDSQCIDLVSKADLICIFGSSIGETDNFWWEQIGNRLRQNAKVIIFKKGNGFNPRNEHKKLRLERQTKIDFYKKANLNDQEIEDYDKNLYIGINTEIFNLLKNYLD